MDLQIIIVFIVSVSLLFPTNIAQHVLQINVNSEFIVIKKVSFAKTAYIILDVQ